MATHREIINSAIGSWSGFIYQGLCGLLVALKMILEKREECEDYCLQLDGYEDFSILDADQKIVSLHQCKCVKGKTNYDEELVKMKEIRDERDNLRGDVKSFFHCNAKVTIPAGLEIEAYPFADGKTNCEPKDIKPILSSVISSLKQPDAQTEQILAKLESLVNSNVLNTQQISFDSKRKLNAIAREQYIPFKDIYEICTSYMITLSKEDILTQIKTRYIEQFHKRIDVNGGMDKNPHIEQVIVKFANMNEEEMKKFMQRINPRKPFEYTLSGIVDFCSDDQINLFYNLIRDYPVAPDELHWITKNSKQTPSTLSDTQEIELTCREIYDNRANFDAMWIYDWFVGRIDGETDGESIQNIYEYTTPITDVEPNDRDVMNIFKEKKVGIMSLKDKRNGKFD